MGVRQGVSETISALILILILGASYLVLVV